MRPGIALVVMTHRRVRDLPICATVLAVAIAVAGCTATDAGGTIAPGTSPRADAPATATSRASAPGYGPHSPDQACALALKAEQTLRTHQDTDQNGESAIDQDFTNFSEALSNAAQQENQPATAKAMTALANDYSALVDSQSGAAQLPDMTTVENDGTNFDKACA